MGSADDVRPEAASGILLDPAHGGSTEEASHVLRAAARRAPFPSLSGLAFELMGLAWVYGAFVGFCVLSHAFRGATGGLAEVGVPSVLEVTSWFDVARIVNSPPSLFSLALTTLAGIPVIFVSARVAAGLARLAADGRGQGSGANAIRAWTLGRRTQVSALGIWLQIAAMMATATLVLFTPLVLLSRLTTTHQVLAPLHVVSSGLGVAFAIAFGAGLGAVQELSVASLVRHERGVGSAILHAWRLIRNRRATSRRMAFAEASSRVLIVAVAVALGREFTPWAGVATLVVFGALAGGMRCHAWALAYPRVGGLAATRRAQAAEGPTTRVHPAQSN